MAEQVFNESGMDWSAKRKDHKDTVNKTINIILDLYPSADKKDVSHLLSAKGTEERRKYLRKEKKEFLKKEEEPTTVSTPTTVTTTTVSTTTIDEMDSHFKD
jgi:hypothetical protein